MSSSSLQNRPWNLCRLVRKSIQAGFVSDTFFSPSHICLEFTNLTNQRI